MNPNPHTTVPGTPPDLTAAYAPDTARLFGRYELLRELGRGGMGVVYAARDPELRREVAVKVLAPELAADSRAVERFLREARAQARIAHEHVVPVYDVGQDAAGGPYIVMPLLEGAPLSAVGALPVPELVRVGREIAEGLAAAHAAGLIHRDIKPANVWLEAPNRRVRVLDFGLARDGAPRDPARSAPDSFAGTPAYMSPEQARGRSVDFRSDLFSLGAVLFQLATGTKPFPQTVLLDLLNAVAHHNPPPLAECVPDCPPGLSALVAALLAKDPGARPAGARQVADELRAIERALGAPPVLVLPTAPADPFAQLDTDADADLTERELPPAPRASEAPPGAVRGWLWPAVGALVLALGALVWLAVRAATPDKPTAQPEPKKLDPAPKKPGPKLMKPVHTFTGPVDSTRVVALAYSADGSRLAAQFEYPNNRFTIAVWDARLRADVATFPIDSRLDGLGFLPDGKQLATVDIDGRLIRVWPLDSKDPPRVFGNGARVRFLNAQTTADGELVTGCADGKGRVFATDTGAVREWVLAASPVALWRAPASARYAYTVTEGESFIRIADALPPTQFRELRKAALHLGHPFTDDGRYLVAVRGNKVLWVNAERAKVEKEFAGLNDDVRGGFVAVTPDGKFVAACSTGEYTGANIWPPGGDQRMRVWDTTTGAQVSYTEEYPGTAQVLAVARDSKFVALGGYMTPAEVRVYKLEP